MANERARALRKNLTRQEVRLWLRLRDLRKAGLHFRRQSPVGRYVVDFLCMKQKLVVEVDGGHHAVMPHDARDAVRDAYLAAQGYRVMRIWNSDVDDNIGGVVEAIVRRCQNDRNA